LATSLSVPSFGQTAAPASEALTAPALSGIAASASGLQPTFDALDARLGTVNSELDKADRRTSDSQRYGLLVLGLNGMLALLVVLVLAGVIGRSPLISRSEMAGVQKLERIRKRQDKLKVAVEELELYMLQKRERHKDTLRALSAISEKLTKPKDAAGAAGSQ
jgi:hypothetical protein